MSLVTFYIPWRYQKPKGFLMFLVGVERHLRHEMTLREKCPYSEFFWSFFSRIPTEYGEILRICPYPVRMRENTDQKNSE